MADYTEKILTTKNSCKGKTWKPCYMGLAPGMIDLYVCLPNVFIEGKITFPDIKSVFLYNKSMNFTFQLRISPSCPATSEKKLTLTELEKQEISMCYFSFE